MIHEYGGKFVVRGNRNLRRLGTHETREAAERQEQAIRANSGGTAKNSTPPPPVKK